VKGVRLASALTMLVAACGGTEPDPTLKTIPADQFIDTYVELRLTALRNADGEITPEQRDSILSVREVRSEQMLEFAEVHGRRAQFMQTVWDSVEARFSEKRAEFNRDATGAAPLPDG